MKVREKKEKETSPLQKQEMQYQNFEKELKEFYASGREDLPINEYLMENLRCKRERLRLHGLNLKMTLKQESKLAYDGGIGYSVPKENGKILFRNFANYKKGYLRKRTYLRGDKKEKTFKEKVTLVSVMENLGPEEEYQMMQYHWVREKGISNNIFHILNYIIFILLAVAFVFLSLVSFSEGAGFAGSIFMLIMLGIPVFLVYIGLVIIHTIINSLFAIRNMSDLKERSKEGAEVLSKIKNFDSSLEENHLEKISLYLLEKTVYQDQNPHSPFYNIIDMKYQGAMRLESFSSTEDSQKIGLSLFMIDTLVEEEKLEEKEEVFYMELVHEGNLTKEEAFSKNKFEKWSVATIRR